MKWRVAILMSALAPCAVAALSPMPQSEIEQALNDMHDHQTSIHVVLKNRTEIDALFIRYDEPNERLWFKPTDGRETSQAIQAIESVEARSKEPNPSVWSLKSPKTKGSPSWIGRLLYFVGGIVTSLFPNASAR